jgi:hypothetical protein
VDQAKLPITDYNGPVHKWLDSMGHGSFYGVKVPFFK